jgi:hypothetical protein
MGYKLAKIKFCGANKLKPNEERDIVIELEEESRAAIHGVVKFKNDGPVEGAVVKLFKKGKDCNCDLIPVTFTFTDKCGQFLFGVDSCFEYVIKVFFFEPECENKDNDCDHHKEC